MRKSTSIYISLIVILVIIVVIGMGSNKNEFVYEGQTHIVESGETLYDISYRYLENTNSIDIREYVYELREFNDIDSLIYPGQKIKILNVREK